MFYLILFLILCLAKTDSSNQTSLQIILNNRYNIQYDQTFSLGTPAQSLSMVFSTAASWIQIPSSNCTNCLSSSTFNCESSSTCKENTTEIVIKELAICHMITENLYLTESSNVTNQTMLLILKDLAEETEGILGLGLGPILLNDSSSLLITLQKQGLIQNKIFAFYLSNSVYSTTISSGITIGDYNSSLMQTSVVYVPLCGNDTWCFNATNVTVGNTVIENSTVRVHINSAVITIVAPFNSYTMVLTYLKTNYEACIAFDDLIRCSCPSGMSNFPSLKFYVSDKEYILDPEYYITEENSVCSVKITSGDSEENYWILGIGFLQKYYTIFDAENLRIGLAEAVQASLEFELVYEDTVLVGILLFAAFLVGLTIIWVIEKGTKYNELDNKVQELSY